MREAKKRTARNMAFNEYMLEHGTTQNDIDNFYMKQSDNRVLIWQIIAAILFVVVVGLIFFK